MEHYRVAVWIVTTGHWQYTCAKCRTTWPCTLAAPQPPTREG